MSFSDDPTSPTKKKRGRSNQEPRECHQDYSFLSFSETEKQIMNQQLLEMSRFSVSPINRDEEALKSRHGSSLENPNHFETEKRIMSQEPHQTSRFSVFPVNRDEEALKSRHGSFLKTPHYFESEKQIMSQEPHETSRFFVSPINRDEEAFRSRHGSFSINPNYFETEKQIMSQESHETSCFSVSPKNRVKEAFKSQHGSFSETKDHSEGSLDSTGNNNDQSYLGLGNRTFTQLQMSNTSLIGIDSGEGYVTNYPDSFADRSNFFLGSGGNRASMSSQRDDFRPEKQHTMSNVSNSSITDGVGMYTRMLQEACDNYNLQRLGMPGEGYGTNKKQQFQQPTIKKILSRTDVGKDIWRLVLTKHSVEQNIPKNLINEVVQMKTPDKVGVDINLYDHDTKTTHKLCLTFTNRYFLKGSWTKDFMIRRNLKAGDEIGLFWDSYASRLQFSVISRAKTKAPAVKKKP